MNSESKILKVQIRQSLKKRYSEQVVRKGMARGERWMKKAYGEVDYVELCSENKHGGEYSFFAMYCDEVGTSKSVNTETEFSLRRSNRK